MLVVVDLLKMRKLESRLIQEILIVGMNRDNCLPLLSMAHKRANSKSKEYFVTEILQHGAPDNKSQAEEKKVEEHSNENVGDENESVSVSIRSVSEQSS